MNKTKIFLIPHWAMATLERHQLSVSAILDIEKVRQHLSIKDTAGILALQSFENYLLGSQHSEFSSNIFYEWSVSASPKDTSFLYDQLEPLSKDQGVLQMVQERLFNPTEGIASKTDSDLPWSIVHLKDNAFGVVLKEHGLTPVALGKHRLALVRAILKQLYVYESQPGSPTVAKSPLYLRYLELLNSN